MKALFAAVFVLICMTAQATASTSTVTCFLDGAKVEFETGFTNGYLEVSLPGGMIEDSLRIKPEGDTAILRVERHRLGADRETGREVATLTERKNLLADKLKALEAKERIFAAAAKSQSGRALRRTKNNPEPLADIRKGTAFAVSQLDSVFVQKQKYEKEMASLDAKLSMLRTAQGTGREICGIWFSSKSGRARIKYLTSDRNWRPVYDFRLDGSGHVRLIMRALLDPVEKNSTIFVLPGKMSDPDHGSCNPVPVSRNFDKVVDYTFTVANQVLSQIPISSILFSFSNGSGCKFPPGDASCYLQGEYMGGFTFKGAAPKESVTLTAGKLSGQ